MIKNYYSFLLFGFMAVATSLQASDHGNKPETKEEEKEEAFENGFEKAMQAKKKISRTRKVFSKPLFIILGITLALIIFPTLYFSISMSILGIAKAFLRKEYEENIKFHKRNIRNNKDVEWHTKKLREAEDYLKESVFSVSKNNLFKIFGL